MQAQSKTLRPRKKSESLGERERQVSRVHVSLHGDCELKAVALLQCKKLFRAIQDNDINYVRADCYMKGLRPAGSHSLLSPSSVRCGTCLAGRKELLPSSATLSVSARSAHSSGGWVRATLLSYLLDVCHMFCHILHETCLILHESCLILHETCLILHESCLILHEPYLVCDLCLILQESCLA